MSCTIFIASDHAGFPLKEIIKASVDKADHSVVDLGPQTDASTDYPLFAHALCAEVVAEPGSVGILICGSGMGMSMAANRHKGIRAALCTNEFLARMSRLHNNANVLCLGHRVTGQDLALAIVDAFLGNSFEGGRHTRRVDLIEDIAARPA